MVVIKSQIAVSSRRSLSSSREWSKTCRASLKTRCEYDDEYSPNRYSFREQHRLPTIPVGSVAPSMSNAWKLVGLHHAMRGPTNLPTIMEDPDVAFSYAEGPVCQEDVRVIHEHNYEQLRAQLEMTTSHEMESSSPSNHVMFSGAEELAASMMKPVHPLWIWLKVIGAILLFFLVSEAHAYTMSLAEDCDYLQLF